MKLKDMTGQRFGRLTVIERDGTYETPDGFGKSATWLCKCDCGNEVVVVGRSLRQGFTKSCGCLRREMLKKGMSRYESKG